MAKDNTQAAVENISLMNPLKNPLIPKINIKVIEIQSIKA
jgi:hypothetical protein